MIDPCSEGRNYAYVKDRGTVPVGPYDDLYRGAGTMITVRWVAVPWVLLQIVAYEIPYPAGYKAFAFGLLGALVVGNFGLLLAHRSDSGHARARAIALAGLALDVVLLSAFVWLFAFDYQTQVWAVLFIAPLEGAILFQLVGALSAWAVIAVSYALREVWGADRYGYPLLWNSISFRMGIAGIIALVAGFMARDLLRQRTQLTEALTKIQRIDQMRSGLVSMLGHDVRTPLTVIRGAVQTLIARSDEVAPQDRKALLESADRQARRLESLANDLLDLARLEEGRLDLGIEQVSLAESVRRSLTFVEGAQGITVDVPDELEVRADPSRFEQVIINLVTNALHHGAMPVTITARAEGAVAIVEIADRGKGVPDEEVPRLFEPFKATRKSGSIGYGLAVVSSLIEAQGGTIQYEPNPGGGALFRITLPRS